MWLDIDGDNIDNKITDSDSSGIVKAGLLYPEIQAKLPQHSHEQILPGKPDRFAGDNLLVRAWKSPLESSQRFRAAVMR